jgi:hypothetical protein
MGTSTHVWHEPSHKRLFVERVLFQTDIDQEQGLNNVCHFQFIRQGRVFRYGRR